MSSARNCSNVLVALQIRRCDLHGVEDVTQRGGAGGKAFLHDRHPLLQARLVHLLKHLDIEQAGAILTLLPFSVSR
jgi:hypothetical protein